jgi:glycosyltransferase involved in cell wall biosynthesis
MVRKAREHPFADRIHCTGFQENPVPCYQSLDLLVVPSINEGLSNAVLEAMACGVPVLANKACGNADVLANGENGFVRDLSSREKLHSELAGCLSRAAVLVEMKETCRARAVENFSIDKMTAGYEALYRQIGSKKSRYET